MRSWSFHVHQIWLWSWTPSIRVWSMDNERFNDPTNGKWMVMQLDVVSKETMRYMVGTPEKYYSYSRRIPPIASSLTPSWWIPRCSNLKRRRDYMILIPNLSWLVSTKEFDTTSFMQGQFDLPPPTYLPFLGWMIEANSTDCKNKMIFKTSMASTFVVSLLFNPIFFRLPQTIACVLVRFFRTKLASTDRLW